LYIKVKSLIPDRRQLNEELKHARKYLEEMEQKLVEDNAPVNKLSLCPPNAIPINADLINFDYELFINEFKQLSNGRLFDALVIDPPWKLSGSNPI